MVPPNTEHQRISQWLCRTIDNHIQAHNGNCEVLPAPFAVFLNKDDKTYVEPDISIICDKDKITKDGCSGAPDWVLEIVSPGSRRMDYYIKLFKYRSAGVREYWIIDPLDKSITVYAFSCEDGGKYSFSDKIKSNVCKDLEIDFSLLARFAEL